MGLLSSLFGGGNDRSASWPDAVQAHAVIDLRERSICGVKLGQPAADLERIGRPANAKPFKAQVFEYPRQGMVIDIELETVCDVRCVIRSGEHERVPGQPCEMVMPAGVRMMIDHATQWDQVAALLPKPDRTDCDDDECVYWIRLGSHWLNVECAPDGSILALEYYVD